MKVPCAIAPDEWFFPKDDDYSEENVSNAKALCATCPLIDACDALAQKKRERYGVWAGKTPAERGLKNPPIVDEEDPEPNLCAGGCGYTMPAYIMAYVLEGQRNYYARGRCANCYKRDVRSGELPTVPEERSTFNARPNDA